MKILSLSGFIPEQICDTVRFEGYHGNRNISQYCGYASDFISQVLYDESIDGAVFPKSCDSCRIIGSYLKDSGKYIYQLPVPVRSDSFAAAYFAEILKMFEKSLKETFPEYQADIVGRTEIINQRNKTLRKIYERLDEMSYSQYLRRIHQMLLQPLSRQLEYLTAEKTVLEGNREGKRVYLVGSFLTNLKILDIIEDYGLQIAGDDLPESGRLSSVPEIVCTDANNIYESVSESILRQRKSPTQDDMQTAIQKDLDEIQEKGVNGVIFVTQKFCEPYNYYYFLFRKELEKRNIPSLQIELSDSEDFGKTELEVEAFSDLLGA